MNFDAVTLEHVKPAAAEDLNENQPGRPDTHCWGSFRLARGHGAIQPLERPGQGGSVAPRVGPEAEDPRTPCHRVRYRPVFRVPVNLALKRGQVFKNIRLTLKSGEIECGSGKSTIVLKTQFLKKV